MTDRCWLDALAALVQQMTPGRWGHPPDSSGAPSHHVWAPNGVCVAVHVGTADAEGIVALVNAFPDLLRLARKALEAGKPTDPIEALRRLSRGLSYCDDCQQPACDDAKPEGPHVLCHDCAVKHMAMLAAPPPTDPDVDVFARIVLRDGKVVTEPPATEDTVTLRIGPAKDGEMRLTAASPATGGETCERCQHRYDQPDLPDAYCARTIFRISRPEDISKAAWLLCATCDDLGNFCGAFTQRQEGVVK